MCQKISFSVWHCLSHLYICFAKKNSFSVMIECSSKSKKHLLFWCYEEMMDWVYGPYKTITIIRLSLYGPYKTMTIIRLSLYGPDKTITLFKKFPWENVRWSGNFEDDQMSSMFYLKRVSVVVGRCQMGSFEEEPNHLLVNVLNEKQNVTPKKCI